MPYTPEELALFESVIATGICHDVALQWQQFMDGTGVQTPVPKARASCSVCLRQYIKSIQIVDLDSL